MEATYQTQRESASSDETLVRAWKAGDRRAGSRLLRRYQVRLQRFFRARYRGDVEDLVQQTLVAGVEGLARLHVEALFGPYLFAVARRELGHQLDRDRCSARRSGTQPDDVVAGDAPLERGHAAPSATRLFAMINPNFAQVLDLYYLHELRGPEIAAQLRIPEATVRSRLRRGLAELRITMRPRYGRRSVDASPPSNRPASRPIRCASPSR